MDAPYTGATRWCRRLAGSPRAGIVPSGEHVDLLGDAVAASPCGAGACAWGSVGSSLVSTLDREVLAARLLDRPAAARCTLTASHRSLFRCGR
jgi:hypothetical protein